MSAPKSLPAFPVDDFTLDALEHALGGALACDGDGEPRLVGADFSLSQFLDFMSGYDPSRLTPLLNEYDTEIPDAYEYPDAIYHHTDVIRALIAEVRRLRAPAVTCSLCRHALDGHGPIGAPDRFPGSRTCPDCPEGVCHDVA